MASWKCSFSIVLATLLASAVDAVYLNDSAEYTSGALGASPSQSYQSSNFTPVELNFNVFPSTAPQQGYLLLAPRGSDVAQPGPMIFDAYGELVWDGSQYGQTLAFSQQTYQGKSVLAFWTPGSFNANGWGMGYSILLDETYTMVANISSTVGDHVNDFHEFQITTNDTALITVYVIQEYDLSSYNVTTTDNSTGWLADCYAQEIDIATGDALFTWNALDHVDPSLCYASPGTTGTEESTPWDYFHINSIEKDDSGNFLISSRHCHAIYYVEGSTGDILWSINGMNSSFTMGTGSTFEWQHDARWHANQTQISVFDNAATSWESDETEARGLLLNVDRSNMSVTLAQEYLPWNATVSSSQGGVQQQPNGNMLIGWGQNPFFSEYDANGTLLWSAQFGVGNVQGYRAIRANWTAYPTTTPNVSVVTNSTTSNYDIYTSWNGATEVSTWELLGANDTAGTTESLANATRTTFETSFSVAQSAAPAYFQVRALMPNGSALGYSDFIAVNGTKTAAAAAESSSVTVGTAVGITATSAASTATSSSSSTTSSSSSSASAKFGRSQGGMSVLGGIIGMIFGLSVLL